MCVLFSDWKYQKEAQLSAIHYGIVKDFSRTPAVNTTSRKGKRKAECKESTGNQMKKMLWDVHTFLLLRLSSWKPLSIKNLEQLSHWLSARLAVVPVCLVFNAWIHKLSLPASYACGTYSIKAVFRALAQIPLFDIGSEHSCWFLG